jgi:hypothetical protein
MPPSESSALLPGRQSTRRGIPFSPLKSTRHLLLGSYLNVLIVFVPLAIVGEFQVTVATLNCSRAAALECRCSILHLLYVDRPPRQSK